MAKMAKIGPKLAQNGPRLPKMAYNDWKWPKMAKMTKNDTKWPK